ncbi:MAG: hypothetical protein HZB33_08280 [Nitrospirae bacterium]|nr:hypothetical protein [Nitrospirota bacterium]
MKIEINIDIPTPSFAKFLPHVLLGVWLVLIGAGIWQHAAKAAQPPIYDSLTYFQKARNIWTAIYEGKLVNPFNAAPTFRPPGTVVMSYPFGFSADYRTFYFRSVFFPVLCLVLAVYTSGYSKIMSNSEKWDVTCFAMFLSSIPMFYHFERVTGIPSPVIWGLVDSFLAGSAALGVAFCLRSIMYSSMRWLLAAAALSGFCLLIKPSGSLVMALTGATWVGGMLFGIFGTEDPGARKQKTGLLIRGVLAMGLIYGAVVGMSVFSRYLSLENLSFGKAAIKVMHDEMKLTPALLLKMIHISFGETLPLLFLFAWSAALGYGRRIDLSGSLLTRGAFFFLAAVSFLYIAVGAWFWIVVSGGVTQVRYFFPFPLMAAIAVVPLLLLIVKNLPSRGRVLVRLMLLVPALNILLLLNSAPSSAWQRWTGVNLSTGIHREEVEQAKRLVQDLSSGGKNVFLYSLHSDAATSAFEGVGAFEAVMNPAKPVFLTRLPVDWQGPAVIKLDDILTSKYVIFTPIRKAEEKEAALAQKSPRDYWQEQRLFLGLFTDLTGKDGVEVVSETEVRLLKIVDRQRLAVSLREKLKDYSWRPVFEGANADRWLSQGDLAELLRRSDDVAIRDVLYSPRYKVHALSLARTKEDVLVKVWWEQIQNDGDKDWYLFCHLLDDKGTILYQKQVLLADRVPLQKDRKIQFDTVRFPSIGDAGLRSLAFGVYNPPSSAFFHADSGTRDWDNRRVIVPVPKN